VIICAIATAHLVTHASTPSTDSLTSQSLLRVASLFNQDYSANRVGAVYERWDARSQSIITRSDYIRRHIECPTAPGEAVVESAEPSTRGYWSVRYSISGLQFVDYWHYVNGRWRFSLVLSNPDAVKLYKLSFTAYAAAVGCTLR
jgi:hypothetical protein